MDSDEDKIIIHSDIQYSNMDSPKPMDGHQLSEFVYGTVAGLVAISGFDAVHDASWGQAVAILLVGSTAIWLAHAYAILVGHRVASGRRLTGRALVNSLSGSWPIVVAGFILSAPLLGAAASAWSLSTALRITGFTGLAILALAGFLAGVVTRESLPRHLLLAALSTGIGFAIIAVERIIHH